MEYSQQVCASRFRPGWLPSLLVAALLPVLLGLGVWQLERAAQKQALLDAEAQARVAAPLTLDALEALPAPAFHRVRLYGRLDAAHSLLLDSRSRHGQVGVELLQPLYDELSARWVWVNRGWLAWPDRRQPVRFSTPDVALALSAWVHTGAATAFELQAPATQGWPRLVSRLELAALWDELGRQGSALELRLAPGPAALAVDWPLLASGPERHYGYAVQWFALALALLLLFIHLGLQQAREQRQ